MKSQYFSDLIPELATRSSRATISMLSFSNTPLRTYLRSAFATRYGENGSFLGDPVFEATFGWELADKSMSDLSGNLLTTKLVDAMDNPPDDLKSDYRFPKSANPYRHQLQAWQILSEKTPQSVVVTSGTGSGKTECFMVPILNRLVQEHLESSSKLVGIRALFLYPLNALINSQRDRLRAWTAAFEDKIRFCLYNGLTPNEEPAHKRQQVPNQVLDRKELRAAPPPILVTNATMLEYMLVRAQDAPILQASQGKLQWIVLDEAHTYIGSQAAELALLLRRVLHAFGVNASQVRFVATSATIGDPNGEAGKRLAQFLADLAGVPIERVHVVAGSRSIPALPSGDVAHLESDRKSLQELDDGLQITPTRFAALSANRFANRIRNIFTAENGKKPAWQLKQLAQQLFGDSGAEKTETLLETLRWLDLLTATRRKVSGGLEPFLPLRAHLFHQTLRGLWACADPQCTCKKGTSLESPEWPFGLIYFDERRQCECGAPVYELRSCNDCNTSLLWARLVSKSGKDYLFAAKESNDDEFSLEVESVEDEAERPAEEKEISREQTILVANHCLDGTAGIRVAKHTFEVECSEPTLSIDIRVRQAHVTDDGTVLSCPHCGGHHDWDDKQMFRRAVLGAPFMLGQIIPTLLEFCPDGPDPLGSPYRGRRMISFTDSRQGTARIAAKIQQDSERNRVRGLVYRRVITAGAGACESDRAKAIKSELEVLLPLANQPGIAPLISSKQAELAALSSPQPVMFKDLAKWLATNELDISRWMFDYYRRMDPNVFSESAGREELAKMALAREFARRPKRLNSLETMGLVAVCYPKLEKVNTVPPIAATTSLSLDDWKAFLKICLDFHVRQSFFIDLPECWKKWGGDQNLRKWLLPPTSQEKTTGLIKKWPQCRAGDRQHRLIRLLSHVLKLDHQTDHGRDTLDSLMRSAWESLCTVGLLQSSGDTRRFLSFEDMGLMPITKGWLCPVTRRVLDVTLKGTTPYLPLHSVPESAISSAVVIPQCPVIHQEFNLEQEKIASIRQWLNASADVTALRDQGLWSDLHDRVIEGAAYFRAAEHSAQQPAQKLQIYEKDFKAGKLNLLSCSTTMEMGVDIGGISVVAMNNVPPHPANYLQRAGRAGRRGETRSVALTLCKNNPHDQHIFLNTRWPFDTPLPMPAISLSSASIVQRHFNSMLLAHFLRHGLGADGVDLNKLNCEWFFLPEDNRRAEQFIAWCENFAENANPDLANGLRKLIARTCFEGAASLTSLTLNTAAELRRVQADWMAEYRSILAQLSWIPGPNREKEPAFKALTIQSKRLTGEYLLTELATEGFLPGYGFPTDIASFDNLTVDEIKANEALKEHREDNLMRRRDLASRDRVTALREYAPGAEVVMDGMVYRSAGITLNWHAPADLRDISEIQNIRKAWRCNKCGATGTAPNHAGSLQCSDCGAEIESRHVRTFLEPAGFAVDLYESPHNDISHQQYIPVEAPWVQADGPWVSLPNSALGRFRATTNGQVFFHSSGSARNGYAICLDCGRAEPMPAQVYSAEATGDVAVSHLPKVFQAPHWRLRGKQGSENSECAGSRNPRAIQPNIHLGHEAHTDILEIQLRGLNGLYLNDSTIAFTLAVAIRDAVAETIGVEADEIGCDTKQVRVEDGAYCTALIIYDRHASGYCSSVTAHIAEVLRKARSQLECPKKCDSACQYCLLSYDTRLRFDDLNRHAALGFLTNEWTNLLRLPPEYSYFGPLSTAEYQPLPEAIWRELGKIDAIGVKLNFSAPVTDWDIAASPAKRLIYRWLAREKRITLAVPHGTIQQLSEEDRFALAALAAHELVTVEETKPSTLTNAGYVIAEVIYPEQRTAWAVNDGSAGLFGLTWGGASKSDILVKGILAKASTEIGGVGIPASDIRPSGGASSSNVELVTREELNGNLQGFGTRFWDALMAASPDLKKQIMDSNNELLGISYKDRYLNSPIAIAILVEIVTKLREVGKATEHLPTIEVITVAPNAPEWAKPARHLWSDWTEQAVRDAVLKGAFDWCGAACEVQCQEKYKADHARTLLLEFSSGVKIRIRFDQGVSYWQVSRDAPRAKGWDITSYDFSASVETQAKTVAELNVRIAGQSFPTYLWVTSNQFK